MMKALSVRAPWWWFILHGKPIENRDWKDRNPGLRFRGPCLLHASAWWHNIEVPEDADDAREMGRRAGLTIPTINEREMRAAGGSIVGMVDVVDVVRSSASPWFVGPVGLVLRNPVKLPKPVPCKGALGFFPVPADVLTAVSAQGMEV